MYVSSRSQRARNGSQKAVGAGGSGRSHIVVRHVTQSGPPARAGCPCRLRCPSGVADAGSVTEKGSVCYRHGGDDGVRTQYRVEQFYWLRHVPRVADESRESRRFL